MEPSKSWWWIYVCFVNINCLLRNWYGRFIFQDKTSGTMNSPRLLFPGIFIFALVRHIKNFFQFLSKQTQQYGSIVIINVSGFCWSSFYAVNRKHTDICTFIQDTWLLCCPSHSDRAGSSSGLGSIKSYRSWSDRGRKHPRWSHKP